MLLAEGSRSYVAAPTHTPNEANKITQKFVFTWYESVSQMFWILDRN